MSAGGVRFPWCGPIGIVGLAITTGNPERAAARAACSARIFERV